MASLNQCNFIGNVGGDPEVRFSKDGKAIANFNLAVNSKRGDTENTEWIKLVCFGKTAEIAGEYTKKGSSLFITGRLQTRKWQDKDGVDRWSTEIIVETMQMLGSRGEQQQGQKKDEGEQYRSDGQDSDVPF